MDLDELLERVAHTAADNPRGGSNHAPMAGEALVGIGHASDIAAFARSYSAAFGPRPEPRWPLTPDDWRDRLGHADHWPDWAVFFETQLKERHWSEVPRAWLPKLLPGMAGAATHGLIRTAHATRSIQEQATPPRLRELADALAYWAATFQALPSSDRFVRSRRVGPALRRLADLSAGLTPSGLISAALPAASDIPGFAGSARAVTLPDDPEVALSEMTAQVADLLTSHVDFAGLQFVHAITAPASLRLLLPYLSVDARERAVNEMWQVVAAITAVYGRSSLVQRRRELAPPLPTSELVTRSVVTFDDHAIKLTEAALREATSNPNPIYALAATAWTRKVEMRNGGS